MGTLKHLASIFASVESFLPRADDLKVNVISDLIALAAATLISWVILVVRPPAAADIAFWVLLVFAFAAVLIITLWCTAIALTLRRNRNSPHT